MTKDLQQRIRERAYQIWLHVGCPDGRDKIHWDMATELVAIEDSQSIKDRQERDRRRIRIREDYIRYWVSFGMNNAAQSIKDRQERDRKRIRIREDYVRYWARFGTRMRRSTRAGGPVNQTRPGSPLQESASPQANSGFLF